MSEKIRKIIHVDMDAFFASVEQLDHPEWRGKPLAVGGSGTRGVVAAASYEARKYGVRSAMPSKMAKMKCPGLIFAKARFSRYKEISSQIRNIFHEYTDLVEPLSLDEAYLDVTYTKKGKPSATLIAREITGRIYQETGLTASAGVSYNKFLAKVASDVNKPAGLFVITPAEADSFIDQLEVKRFYGIGKVTAARLNEMGVWFGRDLKKLERRELIRMFGKAGNYYYNICRGIDHRPVQASRERKSLGVEHTFTNDLSEKDAIQEELQKALEELWTRYKSIGLMGKTLTLKFTYSDFEKHTKSKTLPLAIQTREDLQREGLDLLSQTRFARSIRLLGLTISNFDDLSEDKPVQLTINF